MRIWVVSDYSKQHENGLVPVKGFLGEEKAMEYKESIGYAAMVFCVDCE